MGMQATCKQSVPGVWGVARLCDTSKGWLKQKLRNTDRAWYQLFAVLPHISLGCTSGLVMCALCIMQASDSGLTQIPQSWLLRVIALCSIAT